MKAGRNDPCPCGSGKKYKKCCMNSLERQKVVPERMKDEFKRRVTEEEIKAVRELQKDLPKDICDKCGKLEVIHEYQEGFGFMEDMPKRKLCFACMEFRE